MTALQNYITALTSDEAAILMRGDSDRALKDGEVYRRPLLLMDATPPIDVAAPRSHAGIVSDDQAAARDKLYDSRDRTLADAWRAPTSAFAPAAAAPVLDAKADIYDRHDAALTEAWRNPPPVAAVASASSQPQLDADPYAARDKALSEAWRAA